MVHLLLQYGAEVKTPAERKYQREWIRDQVIALNQIRSSPEDPWSTLPSLVTSEILSNIYNLSARDLNDEINSIKQSMRYKIEN